MTYLAILFVGILLMYVILSGIPAAFAYFLIKRLPVPYRKPKPGRVFLLMVPLFSLYYSFLVYPQIAKSIREYFYQQGDQTHGDCGETLAKWSCIFGVASILPVAGILFTVVSGGLLTLFLSKTYKLTADI